MVVTAFSWNSFVVSQLKRWSTVVAICASREHHIAAVKSEIVERIWKQCHVVKCTIERCKVGCIEMQRGGIERRSNHYLPAHPLHSEGQMTHSNRFPWWQATAQFDEIHRQKYSHKIHSNKNTQQLLSKILSKNTQRHKNSNENTQQLLSMMASSLVPTSSDKRLCEKLLNLLTILTSAEMN